jgi:hypothetical protein
MGHTTKPATQRLIDSIRELKGIYNALWKQDQLHFEAMLDPVTEHPMALKLSKTMSPLVVTLSLALMEEHKRNSEFEDRILGTVQRMLLDSQRIDEDDIIDGEIIDGDVQRLST